MSLFMHCTGYCWGAYIKENKSGGVSIMHGRFEQYSILEGGYQLEDQACVG
jgi:hypothetical protein